MIADMSGSMERYTRLLLHFVYSLTQGLGQRVEAFTFGTRLTRLSRHLQDRDVERALAAVSRAVADWSGGTRIGDCLKVFNYEWARRVLGGGAVVHPHQRRLGPGRAGAPRRGDGAPAPELSIVSSGSIRSSAHRSTSPSPAA